MWAVIERVKKIIFVLFLSMLPLFFLYLQNKNKEIRSAISWPILEMTGLMENMILGFSGHLSDFFFKYFYFANRAEELRHLRAQVAEIEPLRARVKDLIGERTSILELKYETKDYTDNSFLVAKIIARIGSPWARMLRINKGTRHGIALKNPVIANEGVVGQVQSVSPHFSEILLISDPASAFEVKLVSSNARGLIRGLAGNAGYYLALLDVDALEIIEPNDLVVTTGINSQFPKGIPVGKIVEINKKSNGLTLEAKVLPVVDFKRLDYVSVILDVK